MKITSKSLEFLRSAIEPLDTEELREQYRNGQFPRANLVKDINRRYRWDLLYTAQIASFVYDTLYDIEGLNLAHIDTALKRIVSPL